MATRARGGTKARSARRAGQGAVRLPTEHSRSFTRTGEVENGTTGEVRGDGGRGEAQRRARLVSSRSLALFALSLSLRSPCLVSTSEHLDLLHPEPSNNVLAAPYRRAFFARPALPPRPPSRTRTTRCNTPAHFHEVPSNRYHGSAVDWRIRSSPARSPTVLNSSAAICSHQHTRKHTRTRIPSPLINMMTPISKTNLSTLSDTRGGVGRGFTSQAGSLSLLRNGQLNPLLPLARACVRVRAFGVLLLACLRAALPVGCGRSRSRSASVGKARNVPLGATFLASILAPACVACSFAQLNCACSGCHDQEHSFQSVSSPVRRACDDDDDDIE